MLMHTDPFRELDRFTQQVLGTAARPAGMLFHSSHEVDGQVGIVDFWPSEDAWNAFAQGPLAEGMKGAGIAPPDDLKVTPLLNADGT